MLRIYPMKTDPRLIIDAYERQKEAGEFNGYSEEAKRILFG